MVCPSGAPGTYQTWNEQYKKCGVSGGACTGNFMGNQWTTSPPTPLCSDLINTCPADRLSALCGILGPGDYLEPGQRIGHFGPDGKRVELVVPGPPPGRPPT